MKRKFLILGAVAMFALVVAGIASAAPTMPTIPVSSYGDTLFTAIGTALGQVFPYAAVATALAAAVGLVKRWIGHRKATRL